MQKSSGSVRDWRQNDWAWGKAIEVKDDGSRNLAEEIYGRPISPDG